MDILNALKVNNDTLAMLYRDCHNQVLELQTTFTDRVLPNVLEDGALNSSETLDDNTKEWLLDTGANHI
jgi:hypothetical protein